MTLKFEAFKSCADNASTDAQYFASISTLTKLEKYSKTVTGLQRGLDEVMPILVSI